MSNKTQNPVPGTSQPKVWLFVIVAALVAGFLFLKPYLSVILLGFLVAYLFFPVFSRLDKLFKARKGLAVTITTIAMMFTVAIPVLAISVISIRQGFTFADRLGLGDITSGGGNVGQIATDITAKVNQLSERVTGQENVLSQDELTNFLQKTLPEVLKTVFDSVIGLVSGIPGFFIFLIVFLFIFTGILYNHKKLLQTVRDLSPFDNRITDLYLQRIGSMSGAMVRGHLLIATLQGFASALTFVVLGLSEYYLFFAIVFTFLSLIPLGSGIVTIPIGIIALLLGDIRIGITVLLIHFLLVTNIDNIRPKLVPKDARLPAALTILSAFAGVAYFGLLGVIYGPIIMIILTTTIESYIEQKKSFQERQS